MAMWMVPSASRSCWYSWSSSRRASSSDLATARCLALLAEEDVLAQHGVVLHQLEPLTGVGAVLAGDVGVPAALGGAHLDDRSLLVLRHDPFPARGPNPVLL